MSKAPHRWRRRILKGLGALVAIVALLLAIVVIDGWSAFGTAPEGDRLTRMEQSPQWADGIFHNPQALWNDMLGSVSEGFEDNDYGSPQSTIEPVATDPAMFDTPPDSGLRITWLGHSTLIIEIDGHRFLTDPVWGPRSSPLSWIGPGRWYEPPLALDDIPKVDAVLISHDHYDHLDYPTIVALSDTDTTFIAPLGVGAHLAYWGVPEDHIVEMDWWEEHNFSDLRLVAVPARHASGRHLLDQNRTLWAGYALVGPKHRALFSGDTGLFPGMNDIGERLGPFDVTMVEVGQYGKAWPDWHLGPEQAIRAHQMMQGDVFVPIHWGLFNLAFHSWTEPVERTLVAAEAANVRVATPRPGASFEPANIAAVQRWWPEIPWRPEAEYPIVATKVD